MNTKQSKDKRLYKCYMHMINRCYDPLSQYYKDYGGRGISVCEDWYTPTNRNIGLLRFAQWARENGYSDDLTIDRIDVNGNYCPENCRWVDTFTQSVNRRNNKRISDGEDYLTYREMEIKYHYPKSWISIRLHFGWSKNATIHALKHPEKRLYISNYGASEPPEYRDKDGYLELIPRYNIHK